MKVTRRSMFSGQEHTLELNTSAAEIRAYENGAWLQTAFPNLSAPEREFVKTGITPEEWLAEFGQPGQKRLDITLSNSGGPLDTVTAKSPEDAVAVLVKLLHETGSLHDGDTITIGTHPDDR